MIISEKQIMQLIAIANLYMQSEVYRGEDRRVCSAVSKLLDNICDQQSEELKVIE